MSLKKFIEELKKSERPLIEEVLEDYEYYFSLPLEEREELFKNHFEKMHAYFKKLWERLTEALLYYPQDYIYPYKERLHRILERLEEESKLNRYLKNSGEGLVDKLSKLNIKYRKVCISIDEIINEYNDGANITSTVKQLLGCQNELISIVDELKKTNKTPEVEELLTKIRTTHKNLKDNLLEILGLSNLD